MDDTQTGIPPRYTPKKKYQHVLVKMIRKCEVTKYKIPHTL